MVCVGKRRGKKKSEERESNMSLYSERSLQSETSIQSYSSLASVPSLGTPLQSAVGSDGCDWKCMGTVEVTGGALALAAAGDLLYAGSSGSKIRVWKWKGREKEMEMEMEEIGEMGKAVGVKCMVVVGEMVYSAHADKRIRVWKGGRVVSTLPTIKDYVMRSMVPGNRVRVRRRRKALWIEHVDTISAMAVDGKGYLYSASWDRSVKVWRPSDFRCVESFRAHDDAINAMVVSDDGFLYTASADARVKVWNRSPADHNRHSLVATLHRHNSAINALALSSHSSLLYSAASDRSILVWEREESAQHMTVAGALRGHRRAVLCLARVGDVYLCSGSADKSVRVWRRGPGNSHSCLAVLSAHPPGPVKSLSLSLSLFPHAFLLYASTLHNHIHLFWVSPQPQPQPLLTLSSTPPTQHLQPS